VLARSGAHRESANRKDQARAPLGELVSDSHLDCYAESGRVPTSAALVGASVYSGPRRVVFELGAQPFLSFSTLKGVLEEALEAHREFRIEIKCIARLGNTPQTREFFRANNKKRGKMELFKAPGEDPWGAIGVLEMELRKRRLLGKNMISIKKMPYKTQMQAWEANKARIFRENKMKPKWIPWSKKKVLLTLFQNAHHGISLNPKIVSKSRKRKKAKTEEKRFKCCPKRRGAATASHAALQQPQIVWQDRFVPLSTRSSGILKSCGKTASDVLVITARALNQFPLSAIPSFFCAMIVLKPGSAEIRSDLAHLKPPKTLVLSGEHEMRCLALLVQWLPCVPCSTPQPDAVNPLPNLRAWCQERVRSLHKILADSGDAMEHGELQDVQALKYQTQCLPEFAEACGMDDVFTTPALQKLVPDAAGRSFYDDKEQARKLKNTHEKIAWMVSKHMKH